MWGIFIVYPCVELQRAQGVTLCEVVSFLLITAWLATVRISPPPHGKIYACSVTCMLILRLSLLKNVWCGNNYYFTRFIDGDIPPFMERLFFPIQHATIVRCKTLLSCHTCFFVQMRSEGEIGGNTQAKIDGGRSHIVYTGHNPHAWPVTWTLMEVLQFREKKRKDSFQCMWPVISPLITCSNSKIILCVVNS